MIPDEVMAEAHAIHSDDKASENLKALATFALSYEDTKDLRAQVASLTKQRDDALAALGQATNTDAWLRSVVRDLAAGVARSAGRNYDY